MVSQKVKNIIDKSSVKDLLTIDDENDMILGNFVRVEMLNDIKGRIIFWLFEYAFKAEVFFNDVDSVYVEPTLQSEYIVVIANEIKVKDMSLDQSLINFFHIKLRINIA